MSVKDDSCLLTSMELLERAVEEMGGAEDVFEVIGDNLRHMVTLSDSIMSLWKEYSSLLSYLGFSVVFALDVPTGVVCRHVSGRRERVQASLESLQSYFGGKEVE